MTTLAQEAEIETAAIKRFLDQAESRIHDQPESLPFNSEYGHLVIGWLRARIGPR